MAECDEIDVDAFREALSIARVQLVQAETELARLIAERNENIRRSMRLAVLINCFENLLGEQHTDFSGLRRECKRLMGQPRQRVNGKANDSAAPQVDR